MRIESINAGNNNEQHKPHAIKNAGSATGKSASGILFEEYLNAHIKQASTPVITRQSENQLAGLLSGYLTMQKASNKPDRETNAS